MLLSFQLLLRCPIHRLGNDCPFPGSIGDRWCWGFQGMCFTLIPASKHAFHLLEGKNKAALFNFWKKPDDSGKGSEICIPALPVPLSQLLLPERQKHVAAKNTLQREYILSPVGEYKLIWAITYTTLCGWEKQFQTSFSREGFPNEAQVPALCIPYVVWRYCVEDLRLLPLLLPPLCPPMGNGVARSGGSPAPL